jgi:hypothetical protein
MEGRALLARVSFALGRGRAHGDGQARALGAGERNGTEDRSGGNGRDPGFAPVGPRRLLATVGRTVLAALRIRITGGGQVALEC